MHIVDITTLEHDAFLTESADGRSLKTILESDIILKVFFDIRNDSDVLFSLYGVHVAGIEDLQLLELASRRSSKRLVHGLAKCIESDSKIGYQEKRQWREIKEKGRRLFAPECGGSYGVFDRRPLLAEIKQYCAQDVVLLPALREEYIARLCDAWWLKIEEETAARIALSQSPSYNGKGRHMAESPHGWQTWNPTFTESQSRKLLDERRYNGRPTESNPAGGSVPSSAISVSGALSQLALPMDPTSLRRLADMVLNPRGRGGMAQGSSASRVVRSFNKLDLHHSDDDGSFGDGIGDHFGRGNYDSDDDGGKDLTACDKECGCCGRCMY